LIDLKTRSPEWSSYHRLVQDLISGGVKRHTFTPWEVELLLDLDNSRLRKTSREGALRKYLRSVQQCHTEGALAPPRFCAFLASAYPARSTAKDA